MKAFADKKLDLAKKLKFVLARVGNIVEKSKNAGYQHFLLFLTMLSKDFYLKKDTF